MFWELFNDIKNIWFGQKFTPCTFFWKNWDIPSSFSPQGNLVPFSLRKVHFSLGGRGNLILGELGWGCHISFLLPKETPLFSIEMALQWKWLGLPFCPFPPRKILFSFWEVAPWGKGTWLELPFCPFLPKEVAPGEHGQDYHFVLLSFWKYCARKVAKILIIVQVQ